MKKNLIKVVAPQLRRYTVDQIAKHHYKGVKSLSEQLSAFPGNGVGFKVFLRRSPENYYMVDHVNVKSYRNLSVYGIYYHNGVIQKKVIALRNTLKSGIWNFTPSDQISYTENGLSYNISEMEKLINEKKSLLAKRNKMLGITDARKSESIEKKNKKKAAATKKR